MSKREVVILGVNGHIGQAVARAFVDNGWDVTGMARTDKHKLPGVRFVAGDSTRSRTCAGRSVMLRWSSTR